MAAKKKSNLSPALAAAQEQRKAESARRAKLSPKQRFEEDAAKRAGAILKNLRSLGNMARRSVYEHTDAHRDRLFEAIRTAVAEAEAKYHAPAAGRKRGGEFVF